MSNRFLLSCAFAVALVSPLQAQDEQALADSLDQSESWSITDMTLRDFTLYWTNDGTFVNLIDNSDRFYTNGSGIELSFDPNLPSSLAEKLAPGDAWENPRFGFGLALKQRIYTSEYIQQTNPRPDDHPYGGYLYFAFSFQRADADKHDHFGLDLGVVGEWSGAEFVQEFIHNAYPDQIDPQGWDTQLANELAINFNYERTWKSKKAEVWGVEMEMLPALGFELGNVAIMGHAKMTMRAGHNLPDDFGPATLLGHKDHTVGASNWGEGNFSLYVHAGVGIDAVGRDIFLDGNTFASSRSTDSEPLVGRASVGLVMRYNCLYVGWAQNFVTERFETQPNGQTFGTLVLGMSFAY